MDQTRNCRRRSPESERHSGHLSELQLSQAGRARERQWRGRDLRQRDRPALQPRARLAALSRFQHREPISERPAGGAQRPAHAPPVGRGLQRQPRQQALRLLHQGQRLPGEPHHRLQRRGRRRRHLPGQFELVHQHRRQLRVVRGLAQGPRQHGARPVLHGHPLRRHQRRGRPRRRHPRSRADRQPRPDRHHLQHRTQGLHGPALGAAGMAPAGSGGRRRNGPQRSGLQLPGQPQSVRGPSGMGHAGAVHLVAAVQLPAQQRRQHRPGGRG